MKSLDDCAQDSENIETKLKVKNTLRQPVHLLPFI
jgi:hypothetical protein